MFCIKLPIGKYSSDVGLVEVENVAKTLFELSRDSDMDSHFDPAVHTLAAIEAGLPGHHAISCREIEDTEIPTDRYFRDAWEDTGAAVEVEMTKARIIHARAIKVAINPLIKIANEEIALSEDTGVGDLSLLREARRRLREMPISFDLSIFTTPEALKAAWPAGVDRPVIGG